MADGRIRVVFGAVSGHGDALIAGGNDRESLSQQTQNARLAMMEAGNNDLAGNAHASEWGVEMARLEAVDAERESALGQAHRTVSQNAEAAVQRGIARLG